MISKNAQFKAVQRWTQLKTNMVIQGFNYIVVDFSRPSTEKRLVMFDQDSYVIFESEVAHGSGSGGLIPTMFSNIPDSHMSSLGAYLTGEEYVGKHGKSRRLDGLDITNNKARARSIVIHAADYIGNGDTGRSWGCFAVPEKNIDQLLALTRSRTLLYAWSNKG